MNNIDFQNKVNKVHTSSCVNGLKIKTCVNGLKINVEKTTMFATKSENYISSLSSVEIKSV